MPRHPFHLLLRFVLPVFGILGLLLAGQVSLASLRATAVFAQGVCPPIQNTPAFTIVYGTVTVNGAPAAPGTVVEARSPRGDNVGCFIVADEGDYGGMYVYGEDNTVNPPIPGMRTGESVAFYVNGLAATASPSLAWSNDRDVHQVALSASGALPAAAAFTAVPRQGIAPLPVAFSDQSSGSVDTWQWDFGDGNSSVSPNPSHSYFNPGVYTVSLTVWGPGGNDTETKTSYITVYHPSVIQADFTGNPTSGPAPLGVAFTDESIGNINLRVWNFGDGGFSTLQHPEHDYPTAGVYTVTLSVSGPTGSDTVTKSNYITVYEPALAGFTAGPTTGPAPLLVQFTDQSSGDISSWLWNFGDGLASTLRNPSHTYQSPGSYTVTLTVNGPGGTDSETKADCIHVTEEETRASVYLPLVLK